MVIRGEDMEAHRLITISLDKIAGSRAARSGINLHRNLLVSSVLHRARHAYYLDFVESSRRKARQIIDIIEEKNMESDDESEEEEDEEEMSGDDEDEAVFEDAVAPVMPVASEPEPAPPGTVDPPARVIVQRQPCSMFCDEDVSGCHFSSTKLAFDDSGIGEDDDDDDSGGSSGSPSPPHAAIDDDSGIESDIVVNKENADPDVVDSVTLSTTTVEVVERVPTAVSSKDLSPCKRKYQDLDGSTGADAVPMYIPKKQLRVLETRRLGVAVAPTCDEVSPCSCEPPDATYHITTLGSGGDCRFCHQSPCNCPTIAPQHLASLQHHCVSSSEDAGSSVDVVAMVPRGGECGVASLVTIFSSGFNGLISKSQEMLHGAESNPDQIHPQDLACETTTTPSLAAQTVAAAATAWTSSCKVIDSDNLSVIPLLVQE